MPTDYYERPYTLVHEQINFMGTRADNALVQAAAAIAGLSNIPSPTIGTIPPQLALPADLPDFTPEPAQPVRPNYFPFSGISVPNATDGSEFVRDLVNAADVPVFNPPVVTINIPNAPAPIDLSGLPIAPVLATVAIPVAPTLVQPELGNILQIVIPTFAGLNLPTFTAVAPTFDALDPAPLAWGEPVYVSTGLPALKARVAAMLAGGTGLTPAVEQALFDRLREKVDNDASMKRGEAFATYASRGFDMPPGMLVEQVNAASDAGRLQVNSFARDILVQSAAWEIENLRFAVTNGISLEAQLISLFNNEAERVFMAAKTRVEADTAIYNAKTAVFSARNQAYATAAAVLGELIKAELAKLEAFKAQIEAQTLVGTVNEQTIKAFLARQEGLKNLVELYKATVGGAQASIDAERAQVQMYGEGVQAYAARVTADKTRFDVYKTQIEGEVAKENLLEISARAFAATVEGYKAKGSIQTENVRAKVEALNAATTRFSALLQAERDRVSADSDVVRSQVAAFQADITKFVALLDDKTKLKSLNISKQEAGLRNIIAYYEVVVKEYDAALGRLEQESAVRVKALESIAATTSQLAAGAMAAMHVSAQMTGAANVSDSYSRVDSFPHLPT